MLSFISCSPKKAISPTQVEPGKEQFGVGAKLTGQETWEEKWQRTLREAQKEGKVVVTAGGEAPALKDAIPLFKQRYGIVLEVIAGRGIEIATRLLTERRNGLFTFDVMIAGLNTTYTALKPAGALDPLEPALILPEVVLVNTLN